MPKLNIATVLTLVVNLLTGDCSCAFSPHRQVFQHKNEHLCLSAKIDPNEGREGSLAAATKALGKVPYGETSRKYRRTVFKHNDWVNHRSSSSRVFENLQSMFFSGVVRQLRPQVGAVTAVAAVVMVWNLGVVGLNPNPNLPVIALPTVPFTLSSPALGLLLVFRTNAAYTRWMVGRDTWSRITAHSKNLVRMASVFSSDQQAVKDFSNIVWLYCRSVMNKLSSPDEDEQQYIHEVKKLFQDSPIGTQIIESNDRTMVAWKHLSVQLHSLPASDPKALIETDKSIIILGECTAICEKIYSSPVPLVYTRHTARFLSLWALLLPSALYPAFADAGQVWATLPASMVLAFFLFGVDELAMQLEEPFSILPMGYFCKDILDSAVILTENDFKEQNLS